MSSCEEITSRLSAIESSLDNYYQAISTQQASIIEKIDNFEIRINESLNIITDGLIEQNQTFFNGLAESLKKINQNQVNDNEILKIITDSLKKLGEIEMANNEYLRNLQQTQGTIPREVLQQISNCEAVLLQLNRVYLGA